MMTLQCGKQ